MTSDKVAVPREGVAKMLALRETEGRSEQDGGPNDVRNDRKEAKEVHGIERRDAELVMELGGNRGEHEQREDTADDTHLQSLRSISSWFGVRARESGGRRRTDGTQWEGAMAASFVDLTERVSVVTVVEAVESARRLRSNSRAPGRTSRSSISTATKRGTQPARSLARRAAKRAVTPSTYANPKSSSRCAMRSPKTSAASIISSITPACSSSRPFRNFLTTSGNS